MTATTMRVALATISALATLTIHTASARAAACSTLENPVYLQIGSTMLPVVRALARKLRDSKARPMTLVFVDGRSCAIVDGVANDVKLVTNGSYVPSTAEDASWTPDKPPLTVPFD